ncbi:MAG: glycosyltransferase family 2 protein [Acidobacteriota bacterium]|nr:glycosyltransferase family 2 protein [Acidobacteriota bacterium]
MPAVAAITASLLMIYVLAGYPLLLRWLALHRPRPIQRRPFEPSVSLIIVVYNGERFLEAKLQSVLALAYPADKLEIIVASDGSTDRTEEIAERFAAQKVSLLRLPRGGKPAALNTAIGKARGEILVLTDVRQPLEPSSVARLLENFADPRVGVASGKLLIRAGASQKEADIGLYWRFETWMRETLSSVDSMFGATGPFYAIRRTLTVPIPTDALLDDVYLPLAAYFQGYRLVMDSRARAYDIPTSLETEFRRKIRTLAGNYQILRAYPALLGPRNRMWLHFMSYKFGRLLLPWLLLILAAASFGLSAPWRGAVLTGQGVFYGLALADAWIFKPRLLKKLSSSAHTFLVMMIATLGGLSVFFIPPRTLWKVTSAGPLPDEASRTR